MCSHIKGHQTHDRENSELTDKGVMVRRAIVKSSPGVRKPFFISEELPSPVYCRFQLEKSSASLPPTMMGGQQNYTFAPAELYSEHCFYFCDIQQPWQASSTLPCISTTTHYLSGGDKKQNKMDFLPLPLGSVQVEENGTK